MMRNVSVIAAGRCTFVAFCCAIIAPATDPVQMQRGISMLEDQIMRSKSQILVSGLCWRCDFFWRMPETTPIETLDRRGWGHKVRCVIRLTNMGEMDRSAKRRTNCLAIWLACTDTFEKSIGTFGSPYHGRPNGSASEIKSAPRSSLRRRTS